MASSASTKTAINMVDDTEYHDSQTNYGIMLPLTIISDGSQTGIYSDMSL